MSKAAIGLLTVIINLIVLGLNLKLYTEHFKEVARSRRKEGER